MAVPPQSPPRVRLNIKTPNWSSEEFHVISGSRSFGGVVSFRNTRFAVVTQPEVGVIPFPIF